MRLKAIAAAALLLGSATATRAEISEITIAQQFGESYSVGIAPMLCDGRAIGSILVGRSELKAFDAREQRMLRTFAVATGQSIYPTVSKGIVGNLAARYSAAGLHRVHNHVRVGGILQ